jgi:hypothetical protein
MKRPRSLISGPPRDPLDPEISRRVLLAAMLPWVAFGANGMSSARYGPEKAYVALGTHTELGPVLASPRLQPYSSSPWRTARSWRYFRRAAAVTRSHRTCSGPNSGSIRLRTSGRLCADYRGVPRQRNGRIVQSAPGVGADTGKLPSEKRASGVTNHSTSSST